MSLGDFKKIAGQPVILTNTIPSSANGGPAVNQSLKNVRIPVDEEGNLLGVPVFMFGANGNNAIATIRAGNNDGEALASDDTLSTYGALGLYNGSTFDFARNNQSLLAVNDATTATYTGTDLKTYNFRQLLIYFNVTSFTDTSYQPELDWKDGLGNYNALWKQHTVKTAAADTVIAIGAGSTGAMVPAGGDGLAGYPTADSATANQLIQISFPVPPIIRLKVTKVHAAGVYSANLHVIGMC
jgi:hypothetical protein